MTTVLDLQRALLARGFDIGRVGADGIIGPTTLGAMLEALKEIPLATTIPPKVSTLIDIVPAEWMPWARMQRIIVHWSAGLNKASTLDRKHYHLIIEGDGKPVRGDMSIADNESAADGTYAAHTLGCNAGSIGVPLTGMAGAVEQPFKAGSSPITMQQWSVLPSVLADLCRRYSIPVTRQAVLSHAEVQTELGMKQRNKWDIARLPFDPSLKGARATGDQLRAAVKARL